MSIRRTVFVAIFCGIVRITSADEVSILDESGGPSKTYTGEVIEESTREVALRDSKEQEQRFPVYQVESIKYDGQPADLVAARSLADQGRPGEAAQALREVLDNLDAKKQPNLDLAIRFELLVALVEQGFKEKEKLPEAIDWYEKQAESFATSRHLYSSLEWGGRAYLASGNDAKAQELLTRLGTVNWPGYREKSQRYLAELALHQGKGDEAARLFDDVLRSTASDPLAKWEQSLARIGRARALVVAGKAEEAERLCRESVADASLADQSETLASVRNTLGDALRAEGKKKEAVLEGYLWVHVMYATDAAEHARALFHLSQLLGEIGYPQYGEQMAQLLRTKFASSEWAQKLQTPSS